MRKPVGAVLALAAALLALVASGGSDAVTASPPCADGQAALVSARTGGVERRLPARALPGVEAVPDGRGGWFVAGGGGLARLRNDGRLDRSWPPQVSPRQKIRALARFGARLYVTDRFRVFALDAATGARLWVSPSVDAGALGVRNGIIALAATRSAVYIGGDFARVGGARRGAVAAMDARTGRLLAWRVPRLRNGDQPGYVTVLTAGRQRLYLGGVFAAVGGVARESEVAAVGLRRGNLTPFAPKFSGDDVAAISLSRDTVLIGGKFGGGAFDTVTSAPRPWSRGLVDAKAIAIDRTTAFLGGNLEGPIAAHNLKAIDVRTGKLKTWLPNLARYVIVRTLAVSGRKVFVGGTFCSSIG